MMMLGWEDAPGVSEIFNDVWVEPNGFTYPDPPDAATLALFNAVGYNLHYVRVVNEDEADVVRQIFRLCGEGNGIKPIAKQLNAEGAPCPRAQQGRPSGWAPSSVREVLHRPLYRGEVIWNKTRKRDSWGRIRKHTFFLRALLN